MVSGPLKKMIPYSDEGASVTLTAMWLPKVTSGGYWMCENSSNLIPASEERQRERRVKNRTPSLPHLRNAGKSKTVFVKILSNFPF